MLKKVIFYFFIFNLFFSVVLYADSWVTIYQLKHSSFKDLYSPENEYFWGTDAKNSRYYEIIINAYSRPNFPADISSFPNQFKLFIPPGTTYVAVSIKTARDNKIGVVARYKQIPLCQYCSYIWHEDKYYDVPWDWETGINLDILNQRDVYLKNSGGTIQVPHSLFFDVPLSKNQAGWLYIKKLPFDSDWIMEMHVTIQVEKKTYLNWYNFVDWLSFEENTTSNPRPTCSSSNFSLCTDQNSCNLAGGYWYGGSCHATPESNNDNVGNNSSNDDNVTVSCSPEHLDVCTNYIDCQEIGHGYWYNDSCHDTPDANNNYNDNNGDNNNFSTKNTGLAALLCAIGYKEYCNDINECNINSLENCNSQYSCEKVGGYWRTKERECIKKESISDKHEIVNISNFSDAMIDIGIKNGMIRKGTKVHLTLNFPPYNQPVDIYGAIYFEKDNYLWFIPNNLNENNHPEFQAVGKNIEREIRNTIIPDIDICNQLGNSYKDRWQIYALVLPSQNSEITSLNDISTILNSNSTPYFLQYYIVDVDCSLDNIKCSPECLEACTNYIDCQEIGHGYWYNNECHANPQ